MNNIVVLGSAISGRKGVEEFKSADRSSQVVIVSLDGHYPYDRKLFAQYIEKDIESDRIFYKPKKFYQEQKISVILDQSVSRINFKKRKILLEKGDQKNQVDFDLLFIAEPPDYRWPDIKGVNKLGVYGLETLKDIESLMTSIPLVETMTFEVADVRNLEIAVAFAKTQKEVLVITTGDDIRYSPEEAEHLEELKQTLESHNGRILAGTSIEEILGDNDVKAVRLKSGKVIATQTVAFGNLQPDLRLFSEAPLQIANNKILVNEQFKTNIDYIYAMGEAAAIVEQAGKTL